MPADKLHPTALVGASLVRQGYLGEFAGIAGFYVCECFDAEGRLKWRDDFPNTVVTVGKNIMLDTLFSGSAYSVTGPFLGLISSASFSAISAADTMASHAGWLEAGNANAPTYSGTRATATFAAASAGSIALASTVAFSITGTGTVKGGFITLGTGAVSTIDSTAGTLFSAGLFTGGDRAVISGDVLNISYSCAL